MTNKTLKKLARHFPAPKELSETMSSLNESDDRAAAIVATSILEVSLERLIIQSLRDQSAPVLENVFQNNGPLSTLWAKATLAQAMGLITRQMHKEIDHVRQIRNLFAHAAFRIDFDHAEVRKHCSQFAMIEAMNAIKERPTERISLGKAAFLIVVRILVIMIDEQIHKIGGGRNY